MVSPMTDVATLPSPKDGAELEGPSEAQTAYRPHLDGLRALAVYLVVIFHAGADRFTGGFIGVDIFFVLSGYLVTQMLMRDIGQHGGVRFGRFYARRARRLLPASAVMLLITAVVYSAVAPPGEANSAMHGFQASYLYVANWFFIERSTGYFGAAVAQNPVLHVWSLAVEEQFYLVWPVLLGGAFWLAKRGKHSPAAAVRVMVAIAGIVSLGWALVLQDSNLDRGYYGTDARAYQLLAGAVLALSPGALIRLRGIASRSVVIAAGVMGVVGVLALGSSVLHVGPITRGALVTVLTVLIIAALEVRPEGLLHWALASGPLVYLGKISYGIYLWHWPVIVVAVIVADPSPASLAAISILLATGVAALSAEILELPIRRSALLDRHRMPVIVAGLAISVIAALLVIPAVLKDSPVDEGKVSSSAGFTRVPTNLNLDKVYADKFGETVDCSDEKPTACTIVKGTGAHVLVMGDSNAEMLIPAFESMARANDLTLSLAVTSGCPWQRGLNPLVSRSPQCAANKGDAYDRVIPALKPDVIVAIDTEYSELLISTAAMRRATVASVPQLSAKGRTIVLVNPLVRAPIDAPPLACLASAKYLEDCRFVGDMNPSRTDAIYQQVAGTNRDVVIADLDSLSCPYLPICDPVIDGIVARWDQQHLTTAFSASLGDELAAYFTQLKLLGS